MSPTNGPRPSERVSYKLAALSESVTLQVDASAKALRAAGRPVISFAAGEPDFPTPKHIVEAAERAATDSRNHKYTPVAGLPELREAIATRASADCATGIEPSQVLVTNGGKQAVYQALQALLNPGDEVLLPAPYWTTYPEAVQLADGVTIPVFAGAEQDYKVTVDQLEAARTPKTTALIFVSPSNPTGAVYDAAEVCAIGEWALQQGIWVISDEIYRDLVYDGARVTSIIDAVPNLTDQTVVLNGVAKSYAMTGWRVGWMIGPPRVINPAINLQSHLSSNVNNIAQRATIAALTGSQQPLADFRRAFDRRRRLILDGLRDIPGFRVPEPRGAFYIYPDVRDLLSQTQQIGSPRTSLELAATLLKEAEIAAVPGEAFGSTGYLRFSYALSDNDIAEGMRRLKALLT